MRAQELEVKSQNYWLMVAELRKAHHRSTCFLPFSTTSYVRITVPTMLTCSWFPLEAVWTFCPFISSYSVKSFRSLVKVCEASLSPKKLQIPFALSSLSGDSFLTVRLYSKLSIFGLHLPYVVPRYHLPCPAPPRPSSVVVVVPAMSVALI